MCRRLFWREERKGEESIKLVGEEERLEVVVFGFGLRHKDRTNDDVG